MNPKDIRVDMVADKPEKGMWHCGPNAVWMTATHLPTGASVTVYSGAMIEHKARNELYTLLSMAIEVAGGEVPMFPDQSPARRSTSEEADDRAV